MRFRFLAVWTLAILAAATLILAPSAHVSQASANGLVISAIYGGGGNLGSTYTHDYIEIFNAGSTPVSLAGFSVQYSKANGTFWAKTTLGHVGSLLPGQYLLARQKSGGPNGTEAPPQDAKGLANITREGSFKVALMSTKKNDFRKQSLYRSRYPEQCRRLLRRWYCRGL